MWNLTGYIVKWIIEVDKSICGTLTGYIVEWMIVEDIDEIINLSNNGFICHIQFYSTALDPLVELRIRIHAY